MPLWAMWIHIRSRNWPVRGHTRRFFLCEAHFLSPWAARLGAMLFRSLRRFWRCKDIQPKKTGSIIHKGLWKTYLFFCFCVHDVFLACALVLLVSFLSQINARLLGTVRTQYYLPTLERRLRSSMGLDNRPLWP